ncbi:MAG: glycerophosphodiester phosphodiesterase [Anaerolineales bacterium]|nr:MAG: glycerophosphodiester phosphodiesterase [Anaerolineales bacterium]
MRFLDGGRVLNIAHRGASSVAPPNTLAAVLKAIEFGADAVEVDVRLSRDGVPVIVHDSTVRLPTGARVRVSAMSVEGLKRIDISSGFDAKFAGERIPTLAEVLESAGGLLFLNIELKSAGVLAARLPRATVNTVQRLGLGERVLVSSFNPVALLQTKRAAPDLAVGLLSSRATPHPLRLSLPATLLPIATLHPHHTIVDARYVARAQRRGLRVFTWTVDEPNEMERLIALGVNGIITNVPQVLRALLETRSGGGDRCDQRQTPRHHTSQSQDDRHC